MTHVVPDPSDSRSKLADRIRDWAADKGALVEGSAILAGADILRMKEIHEVQPPSFSMAARILRSILDGTTASLLPASDQKLARGAAEEVGLWLTSSGTTGEPKPVFWAWNALLKGVPLTSAKARFDVISLYPLPYFAGVQGLIHGILNGRQIRFGAPSRIAASQDGTLGDPLHILGTPSQLRLAINSDWLSACKNISLIAMGGEPASQQLLDALCEFAPGARIAHSFATAEHGPLFSVTDRKAGFPSAFLGRSLRNGKSLAVEDGQLIVIEGGGRQATGDLVRIDGDRVLFLGRSGRLVNVAGQVVNLSYVEARLAEDDDVLAVRIEARQSAASGHVLIARVDARADSDPRSLEQRLRAAADQSLPYPARPRRYTFECLAPSASGKMSLLDRALP